MGRVGGDAVAVGAALGCDPYRDLLLPSLMLDSPKWGMPLMVEVDGRETLICRDVERGNVDALSPRVPVEYYAPYFMVERDRPLNVHPDLATAIRSLGARERLRLDERLDFATSEELIEIGVGVRGESSKGLRVRVRAVPRQQVLDAFQDLSGRLVPLATSIATSRGGPLADLPGLFTDADSRFARLDRLMEDRGADAALISSPINRQELTGAPDRRDQLVLAPRGGDEIFVIELAAPDGRRDREAEAHPSATAAIRSIVGADARILVEDRHLCAGQAYSLQDKGATILPGSVDLSRWRESRAREDLPAIAIAAQASRFAIEGALEEFDRLRSGGTLTELDVKRIYLDRVERFRQEFAVPFAISPYFTNLQRTDRTVRPAFPIDTPIPEDVPSLKIDAGLILHEDGLILGSSDVARAFVSAPGSEAIRQEFRRIIHDRIFPMLKPGTAGEEIHRAVTSELDKLRPTMSSHGLWPRRNWTAARGFTRNVGHLISKQESLVTEFTPSSTVRLGEGEVVAIEIQWAFSPIGLAHEDMAVVTADGGIGLST